MFLYWLLQGQANVFRVSMDLNLGHCNRAVVSPAAPLLGWLKDLFNQKQATLLLHIQKFAAGLGKSSRVALAAAVTDEFARSLLPQFRPYEK